MSFETLARDIAKGAARSMSRPARSFASSQGWPSDVAGSLSVSFAEDRWSVSSEDERAADLEYGTEENRPTGVLRQLSNRPEILEGALLAVAERRMKGVL